MIKIDDLSFSYQDQTGIHPVLKNIFFDVKKGECFGLMGSSGSGKSTILNILMGLTANWKGKILVNGDPFTKGNKQHYKNIQMVFQDPYSSLHPRKSTYQTLLEPLSIHKIDNKLPHIEKALEQVGLNNEYLFRYPHEMSGGQRQRIAIARALMLKSKILLLDEPTSSLDYHVQMEILTLLAKLKQQQNLTYVLVSHNPQILDLFCDRIAILQDGHIHSISAKKKETLSAS